MLENDQGLKLAWIATFAFDTLVFFLTIARTYWYIKAQANQHIHSSLVILVKLNNPFFAQANGTNSILAHVISVTMMSRLLLNLRDESVRHRQRSASGDRSTTAQTHTDTNLVFTTRIIGNLTAELDFEFDSTGSSHRGNRSRSTEENYGSYGGDDDTDDLYELQSLSTRSGFTARTGTVDLEITSMTASGSASGSGSGSGSGSNQSAREGKGRARDKSRLAWVQPDNIASDRGTVNVLPSPATAAESDGDLHAGVLFHRSRSPQAQSPTLSQSSPLSPYPRGHGLEPGIDDDVNDTQRTEYPVERVPLRASGVGETLEMTRLERRTRGQDSSGDHDLYHSQYRQPPRKNS
ncbi:hypothetical protein DFH11DRAFT_1582617 [Phellopilus nigrolimitatus]|nr:hypothetical protein DFH11DRAFT_1582617 [Phellopilus nigrolimitatus]